MKFLRQIGSFFRRFWLAFVLAFVVIVVVVVVWVGVDVLRQKKQRAYADHYLQALALADRVESQKALQKLTSAKNLPYSAFANIRLAFEEIRQGNGGTGAFLLRKALKDLPPDSILGNYVSVVAAYVDTAATPQARITILKKFAEPNRAFYFLSTVYLADLYLQDKQKKAALDTLGQLVSDKSRPEVVALASSLREAVEVGG